MKIFVTQVCALPVDGSKMLCLNMLACLLVYFKVDKILLFSLNGNDHWVVSVYTKWF